MLGMLLNSVDGRFGVYPQPVYTPNRPSTLLSSMPNIAPHPKLF